MKIIITAAGEGKRFKDIGIKTTKYQLIAKDKPLFYWSLISLKNFFDNEFILIFRKDNYNEEFVSFWMNELDIKKYKIVLIDKLTDGQAETVMFANEYVNLNESILIYNIDTHIKPEALNNNILNNDGCIVTTNVEGENWSFAKTNNEEFVEEVSEKIRISNNASVGIYYFKQWKDFLNTFNNFKFEIKKQYKEIYICPMYKYLIDLKKKISIFKIDPQSFVCLGTPDEVSSFDFDWKEKNI